MVKIVIIPETLVAICLEKSIEIIVSIIGILNSEVGYVPINPHWIGEGETNFHQLSDFVSPSREKSQYSSKRQQYILSPSCYLNSFSFSSSHDLIRIPMVSEGKIQQLLLIAIE